MFDEELGIEIPEEIDCEFDLNEEKEYPYEVFVIDSDTPIFRASKFVQEDYVIVKHKSSGKEREFANKTEFYGHWKKKEGGWLGDVNAERVASGKEPFPVDDFEVVEHVRLLDDIKNHVEEGVTNFDYFVGHIKSLNLAPKYKLLIGGKGNYRYELAESAPYKGNRKSKPILFEEIRQAILDKYGSKIEIVDGKEADDQAAVYGKENEEHYKKTGKWKYVIGIFDKDLEMIFSPRIYCDDVEKGVITPTELDCAKHYAAQLLKGDKSVDNIQGLPDLVESLRVEHKIRKGKGIGDTTASKYLESCDSIKEVFERVVKAYRAYYGQDKFMFKDYSGKEYESTWLDRLQETAILIFMNYYDPPTDYHITNTLDEYGVEYD